LFDAARIDGSGHVHFLLSVVLPLSKPALLTVSLLEFIWSWDNFRWPFLVTRDGNMRVLSIGLQQFMMNEGDTNAHLLMAFATLMMLPSVIFYLFTARYFTEGMMTVGIKR
jgi:ABC-type glycerol-3-phosphate transport system permease component